MTSDKHVGEQQVPQQLDSTNWNARQETMWPQNASRDLEESVRPESCAPQLPFLELSFWDGRNSKIQDGCGRVQHCMHVPTVQRQSPACHGHLKLDPFWSFQGLEDEVELILDTNNLVKFATNTLICLLACCILFREARRL